MSRPFILRKGASRLADLADGLLASLPIVGNCYWVDPASGNDSNDGSAPDQAFATIAAAYAQCVSGNHDAVLLRGSATANNPTAALTWAKNFTHLIGVTNPLPGMGQRARIVNTSTADLATLFTLSAYGCIVKNVQFFDGKDKAEDGACVLVSGSRNYFENCFVAGMGSSGASAPATRAGSYSLKVSGDENAFVDCTIGLDTVIRTAANSELIVSGIRNRFIHCDIRKWCETADAFLVTVDNSAGDLRDTIFEDCLFFNYTPNWASGITNAFDMPTGGSTHYVILRGNCVLVGVGSGWADVVTAIYGAGPAPNAGYGVAINPTT